MNKRQKKKWLKDSSNTARLIYAYSRWCPDYWNLLLEDYYNVIKLYHWQQVPFLKFAHKSDLKQLAKTHLSDIYGRMVTRDECVEDDPSHPFADDIMMGGD